MTKEKREMENLDKLPTPALIVFGATLALIFAVRYFGVFAGQRSVPLNNPSAAQVAAVIVDPTALNRASDHVKELSETIESLTKTVELLRQEIYLQRELSRTSR